VAKVLGVDPGIYGGLAIVDIDSAGAGRLIEAIDIPVHGVAAKERVDVAAVCAFVVRHEPSHAYVERAQAMSKQGSSSGFKYGRAVGAIEAAIVCCDIPLTIVEPSLWKKAHRLPGGRQGSGATARTSTVRRRSRHARAEKRSRPRGSGIDRSHAN
jgi:Holliday junction resolvasome RuvABC endonuclease subunit